MSGQSDAVKAQWSSIIDTVEQEWRGLGNSRERARLMSQILGLAELVAAEARAQEREACAATIDAVGDECLATRPGPATDAVVTVVRSAARIVRARGDR